MTRMLRLGGSSVLLLGLLLAVAGCPEPERKLGIGESCAGLADDACITGTCLRLDSGTAFCTMSCDKVEQDCPRGFVCQTTPAGDSCIPREAGGSCSEDGDCPSGHRCDTSPGPGEGVCYIPVSRDLCAPCNSSLQCPEGGTCLQTATGEQFCTTACAEGCPVGYACTELTGVGEQCVPERQTCNAGKPLCAVCRGDAECGGFLDLCVQNLMSGERFCGTDCSGGGSCPTGFSCVDISGIDEGPFQCAPDSTTCEGFCDAAPSDIPKAEAQCGFGRMCELETQSCADADDGRLCAPCADDDDCRKSVGTEGNLCIANTATGETFCGRDCATEGCPLGFSCIDVEAAGEMHRQCVPTRGSCQAGTGRMGDECTESGADDCLTGICLDFGRIDVCSSRCSADADCAEGGVDFFCCALSADSTEFDCSRLPDAGSDGVCAPGGGDFGDDCAPGRPPCRSGLCLDIGTARLCTLECAGEGDCPEGFRCDVGTSPDGQATNICFPDGGGTVGADCTFGPAACASRLCIKYSGNDICTVRCDTEGGCPDDWVCDPKAQTVADEEIAVCVPPLLAP